MEYNEPTSINITLSNIPLKEPYAAFLSSPLFGVNPLDYRNGFLEVVGWNYGNASATFYANLTCGTGSPYQITRRNIF
jgi:hypothetical protein